ncbi:MAG: cupin domain-containing protein [Gemmatimonadales bacterium]|nr:cupin domain-containing protein [Gemmatimonadales bacterium]
MPVVTPGRGGVVIGIVSVLALGGDLAAQAPADPPTLRWSNVPSILHPGAQIAVVSGDPTMPGPTTVELMMPDGYRMPPHTHPVNEFVEVKEGTLLIGIGDALDPKRTMKADVGDTGTAPAGAHHYTIAEGRTRVRVTFIGPYSITYLNANDAPRRQNFPFGY